MNKAHSNINWENRPSTNTPLNAQNLNELDGSVDIIDDRVITLDTTKFNKTDAQGLFKDVSLDRATGVITFTMVSGATKTIDTLLEKIAINFDFDEETQRIVLTLDDGTVKYIDLSSFIKQTEFLDSDTVAFSVNNTGKVTAIVKEGSIQEKHLRPDYLAEIKVQAGKAETGARNSAVSAESAKASEENARLSAESAEASKDNAKKSEANAAKSAENAERDATAAFEKAVEAVSSANAAKTSEVNAKLSEDSAKKSAANAKTSEENAAASAGNALTYSQNASTSETNARNYSEISKGFRDESEQFANSAGDAVNQINKKLGMAQFDVDDDGNLIYTDGSSYNFTVDDNGNLNWEVAS